MSAIKTSTGTKLRGAILHATTLFIPGQKTDGRAPSAINLPQNMQVDGTKEKTLGLELTLNDAGTFVEVKTNLGYGLVPISAFQCIVPA